MRLWNKLPPYIHTITGVALFRFKLKTYLFRMAFNTYSGVTISLFSSCFYVTFPDFTVFCFILFIVYVFFILDS